MTKRERDLLAIRYLETEAELTAIAEGRVVDGNPADVEGALVQEQEEIEYRLGVDSSGAARSSGAGLFHAPSGTATVAGTKPRFQFSLRRALLVVPFVALAGLIWREAPSYVPVRDQVLISAALLLIAAGVLTRRIAEAVVTAMIVWCVALAII